MFHFSSISGENKNYGTPTNPTAPALMPGGSSSGSAVAVAANLVDFSLGKLLTHFKTHAFSFTREVDSYLLILRKIVSEFLPLYPLLFVCFINIAGPASHTQTLGTCARHILM